MSHLAERAEGSRGKNLKSLWNGDDGGGGIVEYKKARFQLLLLFHDPP